MSVCLSVCYKVSGIKVSLPSSYSLSQLSQPEPKILCLVSLKFLAYETIYFQVCLPCNVSYSAIIKLETLKADADWLFDKLDLNQYKEDWESLAAINKAEEGDTGGGSDIRVHGGPGGRGGKPSEKLSSEYFSQISREDIRRLYDKYRVDFEMFGYDSQVQSYIDMGYQKKCFVTKDIQSAKKP